MNSFLQKGNRKQPERISSGAVVVPNKFSFRLVQKVKIRESEFERPLKEIRQRHFDAYARPKVHTEERVESTQSLQVEPVETMPTLPVVEQSDASTPDAAKSVDEQKRVFLRLAGLAGLGAVAASVLPNKAEAFVMGSSPTSGVVGMKDATNARINPAEEDGNLASIKTNTDGFVVAGAGGYVRQDSTGTIAKETGGNLATIAGKDFATQTTLAAIKTQTDKFTFSGSNLLTSASGGGAASTLSDTTGTQINPATEDGVVYLRRMVKLMESQAAVDSANRQRITLDSLGTGTAITTTVPVSGSLTTAGTVSTVTTVSSVTNIAALVGQNQQMFQDWARQAYNSGIRQNLVFS